jgi:hypothetical protein
MTHTTDEDIEEVIEECEATVSALAPDEDSVSLLPEIDPEEWHVMQKFVLGICLSELALMIEQEKGVIADGGPRQAEYLARLGESLLRWCGTIIFVGNWRNLTLTEVYAKMRNREDEKMKMQRCLFKIVDGGGVKDGNGGEPKPPAA